MHPNSEAELNDTWSKSLHNWFYHDSNRMISSQTATAAAALGISKQLSNQLINHQHSRFTG
jgi:hypothetical protein